MDNKQPNKIITALYKKFKALRLNDDLYNKDANEYYKIQSALKNDLLNIARVPGAIEVMSKNNILKLVAMQSSWRFMEFHTFTNLFSKTCQDLKL